MSEYDCRQGQEASCFNCPLTAPTGMGSACMCRAGTSPALAVPQHCMHEAHCETAPCPMHVAMAC